MILIGFTNKVAWGVTALGADQADLFLLQTDREHADQYLFDQEWRAMQVRHERIQVRDGEPVDLVVRETHLGPVTTDFCFAQPDQEVAMRRVPLCEQDRETIQAAWGMMRAGSVQEFTAAIEHWRFPSVNLLVGDSDGNIAYWRSRPSRSAHDIVTSPAARRIRERSRNTSGKVFSRLSSYLM